jgi:HSP20 family protein
MAENQTSMTSPRHAGMARPLAYGFGGSPFTALQRFADDVDRMFEDFGMPRMSPWTGASRGAALWAPAIDVVQQDDRLVIKADVPGLKKEDLSIEVTDDAITIQGERKSDRQEERGGVMRSERSYGSFCRVVPLPDGANTEQANASFRDGVLEITVPVPAATTRRRTLDISDGPAGDTAKGQAATAAGTTAAKAGAGRM